MQSTTLSPSDVIANNLKAYNSCNLEEFMQWFDDSIEIRELKSGQVTMQGLPEVRQAYGTLFDSSPSLHSEIVHRSVIGTLVIDLEIVTGRRDGNFEILIVYEVINERICRVWLARETLDSAPSIRRAKPADLNSIIAVGRETYCEHFSAIWSDVGLKDFLDREFNPNSVASDLASNNVVYLLAEISGIAVGYAKLNILNTPQGETIGELQKIYLRRTRISRGTGLRLLRESEAIARGVGAKFLTLDVLERNITALQFYIRNGFKFESRKPFSTDLGAEGMVTMTKQL